MPRKPRLHFPGAVYHVILRGNGGQDVFFCEADRSRFCLLLQAGCEKFGHRIHAYCLMGNHLHLAVQVQDVPLARIMQNLAFRYTQFINRRRNRIGHLFQGRYKALLIDADSYLLELVRYIHLNPVRSCKVSSPEAYPWSSHGAYLGFEQIPWLSTDWVLGQFAPDGLEARVRFSRFAVEGLGEGHRPEFHGGSFEGRALGDDRFIEGALVQAEEPLQRQWSLLQVIEAVCAVHGLTATELAGRTKARQIAEARALAALLVRESEGLTLAELGKYLNMDLSSLSQAARRMELRLRNESLLAERFELLKRTIESP